MDANSRKILGLASEMNARFEETVKFITDALDEKDREEFSRLKVIKRKKLRDSESESA